MHLEHGVDHLEDVRKPQRKDLGTDAQVHGRLAAALTDQGTRLADADLQIAATALHHDLELVTGNPRRFGRVPGLRVWSIRGPT